MGLFPGTFNAEHFISTFLKDLKQTTNSNGLPGHQDII